MKLMIGWRVFALKIYTVLNMHDMVFVKQWIPLNNGFFCRLDIEISCLVSAESSDPATSSEIAKPGNENKIWNKAMETTCLWVLGITWHALKFLFKNSSNRLQWQIRQWIATPRVIMCVRDNIIASGYRETTLSEIGKRHFILTSCEGTWWVWMDSSTVLSWVKCVVSIKNICISLLSVLQRKNWTRPVLEIAFYILGCSMSWLLKKISLLWTDTFQITIEKVVQNKGETAEANKIL